MPVCGNYLFFELPKKIVLNPKDGPVVFKLTKEHFAEVDRLKARDHAA